jgi:hypothetical protein
MRRIAVNGEGKSYVGWDRGQPGGRVSDWRRRAQTGRKNAKQGVFIHLDNNNKEHMT